MSTIRTEVTPELEAVARAIYNSEAPDGQRILSLAWERRDETAKDRYRDMARAALLALREPTEGMVEAPIAS